MFDSSLSGIAKESWIQEVETKANTEAAAKTRVKEHSRFTRWEVMDQISDQAPTKGFKGVFKAGSMFAVMGATLAGISSTLNLSQDPFWVYYNLLKKLFNEIAKIKQTFTEHEQELTNYLDQKKS
jgi:hypothetical protein